MRGRMIHRHDSHQCGRPSPPAASIRGKKWDGQAYGYPQLTHTQQCSRHLHKILNSSTFQATLTGFSEKHKCICNTTNVHCSAPAQDPSARGYIAASSAPFPPVALINLAAFGRGDPVLVTTADGWVPFLSNSDSGGHGARRRGGGNHLLRRKIESGIHRNPKQPIILGTGVND